MHTSHPPADAAKKPRDPRLDFFRGLCMFIILIAHTPGNAWGGWIPAKFGYSDATEIFVFCSGMASAIAFGKVFDHAGWLLGTARIAYRVWQVYWAHICLYFTIMASSMAFNLWALTGKDYLAKLNFYPFFDNPSVQLTSLFTLGYVPNYFDILPMYLVILAMLPLIIALSRLHPLAALAAVAGCYALPYLGFSGLPAEPWTDRRWFFNPFSWALVFYTGFGFMRGWLPKPPIDWRLVTLAALLLLLAVPTASYHLYGLEGYAFLKQWRADLKPLIQKTDFGLLRYVHFLCLAYLAYCAAGDGGHRLLGHGRVWGRIVGLIRKVGQQSLAIFLVSMVLARWLGFWLDVIGRDAWNVALVNITGLISLILAAQIIAWFKGQPWRHAGHQPQAHHPSPQPHHPHQQPQTPATATEPAHGKPTTAPATAPAHGAAAPAS